MSKQCIYRPLRNRLDTKLSIERHDRDKNEIDKTTA